MTSINAMTLLFALALLLPGCRGSSRLFISGDAEAAGAEIYVDGTRVGVMTDRVYVGSTSDNPAVVKREEELRRRLGVARGDHFSTAEIQLKAGRHQLLLISPTGKRLQLDIDAGREVYVDINFREGIIRETT